MGLNESEPDSVRARGEPAGERRSLWQKLQIKDGTKHVKARTLVVAGMVGAGRQGRVDVEDERAVGKQDGVHDHGVRRAGRQQSERS